MPASNARPTGFESYAPRPVDPDAPANGPITTLPLTYAGLPSKSNEPRPGSCQPNLSTSPISYLLSNSEIELSLHAIPLRDE